MKCFYLFSLFFFCVIGKAIGQQRPYYTQYILNNYILNPAISGIENYTDIKMSARDQWIGLSGAPRTAYLSVHSPIGKKDFKTNATSFRMEGQNPRGTAYWENYTASASHHGAGLMLINDITGNFNRFTAAASYAYHLGLNATTNLSAGFSAGFSHFSLNQQQANFGNGTSTDPAIGRNSQINRIMPDLGAGLWLYSATYFIGLSAQQVIPQKISFSDNPVDEKGRLVPHLFATAGYRFLLNEDINAMPSVLIKYVTQTRTTPQIDFTLKTQYHDLLWLGGNYRLNDGYAVLAGLHVANTFNIGYAFDFTRTNLNTASRGTHELMIGFIIGNKYGETCPRNIW